MKKGFLLNPDPSKRTVGKEKLIYGRILGSMKEKTLRQCQKKYIHHLKPDIQAKFVAAFTLHLVLQRYSLTSVLSIIELIREPTG